MNQRLARHDTTRRDGDHLPAESDRRRERGMVRMDSKTQPAKAAPPPEASGQEGARQTRRGPQEDPGETRWVIEQIQQSFR